MLVGVKSSFVAIYHSNSNFDNKATFDYFMFHVNGLMNLLFPVEQQQSLWFDANLHGLPWCLSSKESAFNAGDTEDVGLIPGSGRSPRGGNGNPLLYSCLENPRDRGTWQAIIHRISKSQEQLNTHIQSFTNILWLGTHGALRQSTKN